MAIFFLYNETLLEIKSQLSLLVFAYISKVERRIVNRAATLIRNTAAEFVKKKNVWTSGNSDSPLDHLKFHALTKEYVSQS